MYFNFFLGLYKVGWVSSHDAICKVIIEEDTCQKDDQDGDIGHGLLAVEKKVTFLSQFTA